MPTADELVAYEDDLVAQGISEQPPGSNLTIIGERFGWNGVAWCAETQSVATEAVFGRRIGWSAAVSEWIAMAQRGDSGLQWVPAADGWIEAGMLVTYDFGNPRGNPSHFHIAMVRDPGTQGTFQTDGGNEGDAMRQGWRDRTYVQGFIALPFDSVPTPPAPQPQMQEDDRVFIIEFIDFPGMLWLVEPTVRTKDSYGLRRHIPNPDFYWELVKQGIKVVSGQQPGGNIYTEVP